MFRKWSLLFLLVFFGFEAGAKEYSLRYEDYVHLSDADKDQVVVKLMEFVVELESKYEYDVKKYGAHSPNVQKLKETLFKINQFLISSAYANPPKPGWDKYAKDFNDLFLGNKEADCIFAGWPSKTYPFQGRSICSHPSKSFSKQVNSRYPKPDVGSDCAKSGTNKIQCNPTLFGFRDMAKKTLFCVDSSNGAQNSAYHCMKLALDEKDKDKDQRLKMLRENLDKNPGIFDALQKYVYELCVCKATPKGFDKSYHERIRPHRTCYGMMNMLGAVTCEMDNVEPLKNTSIFKELQEKISMTARESDIDRLYIDFLKDIPTSAPEEYARMCPNDKPASGITITDGEKDTPGTTTSGATSGATSGTQGGTPGGADPFGERYKCDKAVCSKKTDAYTCDFFIHDNQTNQSVDQGEPKYEAPTDSKAESLSVTLTLDGKEHTLSCQNVEFEGEAPPEEDSGDNNPTLTVTVTKKGEKDYDIKAEPKNDKGWTLVWILKLPKTIPEKEVKKGWDDPSAKKDGKPGDASKDLPGMATEEDSKETTTPPPADQGKTDSTDPEKDKGTTPSDPKEDEKDPSSSTADDKSGTSTPSDSGKKDEEGPATNISQERKKDDYEVCAQLTQGKEKKVPESPVCVKVDKLPSAPVGPGGMMPQQQPAMRRASDTSALGIK